MKTHFLKNLFSYSPKEKKIIYREPTASARETAETSETGSDKLIAEITTLKEKIKEILKPENKDKYNEECKRYAETADTKIDGLLSALTTTPLPTSEKLKKLETQILEIKTELIRLESLSARSAAGGAAADTLAAAPAAPSFSVRIETAKASLEAKKDEKDQVINDIKTAILTDISPGNDILSAAIEKFLNIDGFYEDVIAPDIATVEAQLTAAEALPDDPAAEKEAKVKEVEDKLAKMTAEEYVKNPELAATIADLKAVVKLLKKPVAVCEGGAICLKASEKLYAEAAKIIEPDDPNIKLDAIKPVVESFVEPLILAHIADVIELQEPDAEKAVEKIKEALNYYELGAYSNPSESAEVKDILDKIIKAKEEDKLPNIKIDFLGGTDGTNHRLREDKTEADKLWHEEKKTAFEKLLKFHELGKLDGLTLDESSITLIKGYIEAVTAGTAADFVKDPARKNLFIKGGGLFDYALALQRAENMYQRLNGADTHFDPENAGILYLELGTKPGRLARKSGIKLSLLEVIPAGAAVQEAPRTPDHTYEFERGQLKVTFKGETESAYYTIEKPAEMGLKPFINDDDENDGFIIAEMQIDGSPVEGWFEFDDEKKLDSGKISDKPSIWEKYDIEFDGKIIKITPKKTTAAPAGAAAAAPAGGRQEVPAGGRQEAPPGAAAVPAGRVPVVPETAETPTRTDHEYKFEGGQLKITFKDETEPISYKIVVPDGIDLFTRGNDSGDRWVELETQVPLKYFWGRFEFDDEKNLTISTMSDKPSIWEKYRIALEGTTITITEIEEPPTAPPAAPPGAAAAAPAGGGQEVPAGGGGQEVPAGGRQEAPPGAAAVPAGGVLSEAPSTSPEIQRKQEALKSALETAFAKVNEKIAALEQTVNTNGFLAGTAQAKIDEKKQAMNDTITVVKDSIASAQEYIAAGNYPAAVRKYNTAARKIDREMSQVLDEDAGEAFLSEETKAAIIALRATITEERPKVKTAFDELTAILE